jgi:hypothetical protein
MQRRLDAAVATGHFLTPREQNSRKRVFTKKPVLHHTWVEHGTAATWEDIMVSARSLVFLLRSYRSYHIQPISLLILRSKKRKDTAPAVRQPGPPHHSSIWRKYFRRPHNPPCTVAAVTPLDIAPPPDTPVEPPADLPAPKEKFAQISVFVAMPSISRSELYSAYSAPEKESDDLPEMALGVSRLRLNFASPPEQKEDPTMLDVPSS